MQGSLSSLSIIETLPGPLDLLADEHSLVSEVPQCLFGGRHLLAAQAGAVRRSKARSHFLRGKDGQPAGVFGQLARDRRFIPGGQIGGSRGTTCALVLPSRSRSIRCPRAAPRYPSTM